MSAEAMLRELRAAGLSLTPLPDGNLCCRPKSALTDELRAVIREYKPHLILLLEREAAVAEAERILRGGTT